MEQENKNYTIIYGELGDYKIYVTINNSKGIEDLEKEGYYFDDFCGGGIEKYVQGF